VNECKPLMHGLPDLSDQERRVVTALRAVVTGDLTGRAGERAAGGAAAAN